MKIYKKKKNILGIDIKPEFPKNPHIVVENNFNNSIKNITMDLIKKINKIIQIKIKLYEKSESIINNP